MIKNLFLLLLFPTFAFANCPSLYPEGKPIQIKNKTELCNTFYVVVFDESANRPVFASELLKKPAPVGSMYRIGAFRYDLRLTRPDTNVDYIGSNYDRGHLVPADDGSTIEEVKNTFLLSNVTPQSSDLNRGAWKSLEMRIRQIYKKSTDDVHVVTIPVYSQIPTLVARKIPVPIGYWKVVITKTTTRYFFAENSPKATVIEYGHVDWKRIISQ